MLFSTIDFNVFIVPIVLICSVSSGFFMLKRSVIQGVELNPIGYKICLEILAKGKYEKAKEIPIIFANRSGSKSKMGIKIYLEFLGQIILLCKDQFISKYKNKRSKKWDVPKFFQ